MQKLESLRVEWGKPLVPTSGTRCAFWNDKVGTATHSQHLFGRAADFYFDDSGEVLAFIKLAEDLGFMGLGHGHHKVHVDTRSKRPGEKPDRWTYDD